MTIRTAARNSTFLATRVDVGSHIQEGLRLNSEEGWFDRLRSADFVRFQLTGVGRQTQPDGSMVDYESGALNDIVEHSITLCHILEAEGTLNRPENSGEPGAIDLSADGSELSPQSGNAIINGNGEPEATGLPQGAADRKASDLPALSEPTKRILELRWQALLEKNRLDGNAVRSYAGASEMTRKYALAKPLDRTFITSKYYQGWLATYLSSRRECGITPTIELAQEWFSQLATEYMTLWSPTEGCKLFESQLQLISEWVLDDVASIWKGKSDAIQQWYETVCLSSVKPAVNDRLKGFRSQARNAELALLDSNRRAMTKPAPKVQESTPAVSIRPDSVHSAAPNPFPFGHRSHRAWEQLPQDVREVLSYLALEQRAEILELDSLFQEKFAERASLDLLERYCLERFDLLASQLLSVAIQPGPSSFNTQYENYLDTLQQAGQNNVGTVLKAMRSDVRDEVISRISLKLSSRKSHWLREEINWRLRGCPARPPLKTSLLEGDPGVGSGASSSLDVFVREFADLSDGTGEKIADLTAADLTPKETRGSEPMGVASTVARNVATKQDATAAPGNVRAAKPQASRWEDIDIVFLSEFMVQIGVNSQLEPPQNYAEMGFENKKNKKSNAAWVMLWELAQNGGVYRIAADSRKWSQIEKRMQEIRKAFRCRFALQDDPIPFLKKTPQNPEDFGYRAKFRIRCHPASDA